jgi:NarL family two-component system response regulator LiaR
VCQQRLCQAQGGQCAFRAEANTRACVQGLLAVGPSGPARWPSTASSSEARLPGRPVRARNGSAAEGKSNQQIADELVISLNTVFRHVSNIFGKIGATNRAEATAYAYRQGLM